MNEMKYGRLVNTIQGLESMFSIEGRRTPLTSLFPYSGIIGWC